MIKVKPEGLTMIAEQAMIDIAHLLRPAHLQVSHTGPWWAVRSESDYRSRGGVFDPSPALYFCVD